MSELVKNLRFWYERSDMGDINPELVKQAADLIEKHDRLILLYRWLSRLEYNTAEESDYQTTLKEIKELDPKRMP